MAAMGFTLNQITMLALTLMVGIVIDDAIIVLENIYRFMEEKGMPPFQAAIEGTKEIGLAVMATTLSLLAVFLPIGFMGGIIGRFMSSFGFTASFAIAVSLLVSFTLTPMLVFALHQDAAKADGASQHRRRIRRIFRFLDRHYTQMLEWSMAHRKIHGGAQRAGVAQHYSAVHGGRKELRARRRPQRISGVRARARRQLARRHR